MFLEPMSTRSSREEASKVLRWQEGLRLLLLGNRSVAEPSLKLLRGGT